MPDVRGDGLDLVTKYVNDHLGNNQLSIVKRQLVPSDNLYMHSTASVQRRAARRMEQTLCVYVIYP